jgi:hypothetical protein
MATRTEIGSALLPKFAHGRSALASRNGESCRHRVRVMEG